MSLKKRLLLKELFNNPIYAPNIVRYLILQVIISVALIELWPILDPT